MVKFFFLFISQISENNLHKQTDAGCFLWCDYEAIFIYISLFCFFIRNDERNHSGSDSHPLFIIRAWLVVLKPPLNLAISQLYSLYEKHKDAFRKSMLVEFWPELYYICYMGGWIFPFEPLEFFFFFFCDSASVAVNGLTFPIKVSFSATDSRLAIIL